MSKEKIPLPNKTKEQIEDILNECRIQLEYIQSVYPTGTGATILSRLQTFIQEYEKEKHYEY